jgi:hypothetical protein
MPETPKSELNDFAVRREARDAMLGLFKGMELANDPSMKEDEAMRFVFNVHSSKAALLAKAVINSFEPAIATNGFYKGDDVPEVTFGSVEGEPRYGDHLYIHMGTDARTILERTKRLNDEAVHDALEEPLSVAIAARENSRGIGDSGKPSKTVTP